MAENEVTIVVHDDGPYEIRGKTRVVTEAGEILQEDGEVWLCRCGHSRTKPLCDGSHDRVGFRSRFEPLVEPPEEGIFIDACSEADVPEGELFGATLDGEEIVLARFEGRIYALGGTCTHQSASLCEGGLRGRWVMCPRHNAGFDLVTGLASNPPAEIPLPTYAVKVEAGRVHVSRRPR